MILSQDGETLMEMTGATVKASPAGRGDVVAYRQEGGEAYEVLGVYSDEERAKEVLWEIADEYENDAGMVYDMPLV